MIRKLKESIGKITILIGKIMHNSCTLPFPVGVKRLPDAPPARVSAPAGAPHAAPGKCPVNRYFCCPVPVFFPLIAG